MGPRSSSGQLSIGRRPSEHRRGGRAHRLGGRGLEHRGRSRQPARGLFPFLAPRAILAGQGGHRASLGALPPPGGTDMVAGPSGDPGRCRASDAALSGPRGKPGLGRRLGPGGRAENLRSATRPWNAINRPAKRRARRVVDAATRNAQNYHISFRAGPICGPYRLAHAGTVFAREHAQPVRLALSV